MSQIFRFSALIFIFCALPQVARAQESESAQTVPRGTVQVEGGVGFSRAEGEREFALGEFLTRVGIDPKTEVRISIPAYVRLHGSSDSSGFGDPSIAVKRTLFGNRGVQLAPVAGDDDVQQQTAQPQNQQEAAQRDAQQKAAQQAANGRARTKRAGASGAQQNDLPGPALGIIVGTNLPVGARDIGADRFEPRVLLAYEDALSQRVSLASNLGYTSVAGQRARSGQYFGSVSFGYSVSDKLGYFAEVFGTRDTGDGSSTAAFLNLGAVYVVSDKFELDAGIAPSLSDDPTRNYQLGLGFTKRF